MSYLTTGGSSKEHGTNKPPPTRREKVRRKHHVSYLFPESFSLASVLAEQFRCHQEGPWIRVIGQTTQKLIPSPWNPRLWATWQSSPPGALAYCSLPGCPFSVKSLALLVCVSPQTVHFQVLDKSSIFGGSPFLQQKEGETEEGERVLSCCVQEHSSLQAERESLPEARSARTLTLDFRPPELWENEFLMFEHLVLLQQPKHTSMHFREQM